MDKMIEVHHLTKKFGNFAAVDDISFDVRRGEIFGFLGANGAGKSTAIKMFCGLSRPTSGTGTIAGLDINRQFEKIKQHIGYMSQRFSLYEDLTVRENITLFGGIYGLSRSHIKAKAKVLLDKLEISHRADDLVSSLPLGDKQKLAFSVSIFHHPEIVFLDEPTGGVDPASRRRFWEMIYEAAESGITVFVTTHFMDEAEYCNRICMMVDGRIRALGTPSELKAEYGCDTINDVFCKMAVTATRQ